jgi:hypothetical protein
MADTQWITEADDMADTEWNQDEERVADDAYASGDAEEMEEWMEERQAEKPKSINQQWREANPIAWTITRIV